MKTNIDIFRPWAGNPWKEFESLQRRMDRLFGEFSSSLPTRELRNDLDFLPACDVEEKDNQYLITVDVPGIPKDEIKVEVTGDTLTVSGEHKEERKEEKGKQKLHERYHGRFERSFTLPSIEDTDKVEAAYKDGVLRIAVPKNTASQTRRVQIGEGKPQATAKPQTKPDEKKETKQAQTHAA